MCLLCAPAVALARSVSYSNLSMHLKFIFPISLSPTSVNRQFRNVLHSMASPKEALLRQFPESALNKNEGRKPQISPDLAPYRNILSAIIPRRGRK